MKNIFYFLYLCLIYSCVDGLANYDVISIINKTNKNLFIVSYYSKQLPSTDTIKIAKSDTFYRFFVDDGSTLNGTRYIFDQSSDSILIYFNNEKYMKQSCVEKTDCLNIPKNLKLIYEKGEKQRVNKNMKTKDGSSFNVCWQYSITFDSTDYNKALPIPKG